MIGTVYFLLNLISENKKKYNNSNLNIFTPMTKNREYKEYSKIKDMLHKIFDINDSINSSAMRELVEAGCSFNIYIIARKNVEMYLLCIPEDYLQNFVILELNGMSYVGIQVIKL